MNELRVCICEEGTCGDREVEREHTVAPSVGVERHEEAVGERSHEEQRAEHHEWQLVSADLREHSTSNATYRYEYNVREGEVLCTNQ